jgi:hypothetical protein
MTNLIKYDIKFVLMTHWEDKFLWMIKYKIRFERDQHYYLLISYDSFYLWKLKVKQSLVHLVSRLSYIHFCDNRNFIDEYDHFNLENVLFWGNQVCLPIYLHIFLKFSTFSTLPSFLDKFNKFYAIKFYILLR